MLVLDAVLNSIYTKEDIIVVTVDKYFAPSKFLFINVGEEMGSGGCEMNNVKQLIKDMMTIGI